MSRPELLVLAAGMGSRYGGLKQLDGLGPSGERLLDYAVFDALRAGFGAVVFVIRRDFEASFRSAVAARYEARTEVRIAFQDLEDLPPPFYPPADRSKPWGTAHAIWAAREAIRAPFVAINADDFYGSAAYGLLAAHSAHCGPRDFAMAGFRLRDTLSAHGSVSRGICEMDDSGLLRMVEEHASLRVGNDGILRSGERVLTGEETVSMNFWGFTPEVFPLIESRFRGFLEGRIQDTKAEFYIPDAVCQIVLNAEARVQVVPAEGPWFGITYREDRAGVAARLAQLTAEGVYPSPLWSD